MEILDAEKGRGDRGRGREGRDVVEEGHANTGILPQTKEPSKTQDSHGPAL